MIQKGQTSEAGHTKPQVSSVSGLVPPPVAFTESYNHRIVWVGSGL